MRRRRRPLSAALPALLVGPLLGCSGDTDKRANPNDYVCFKVMGDPGPERFSEFADLVRNYPPAAGLAVAAGYKRDAAVSVKLQPDQDAKEWIDDLPTALRHHEIVSSVDIEDYDCGEVRA